MMIVVKRDGVTISVKSEQFPSEDHLRELLLNNITLIPVEDISDDSYIIASCKEFPVSDGSIDVLALGNEGGIYLIETGLYRNPEKRKVLSQVLDYASAMWTTYGNNFTKFKEELMRKLAKPLRFDDPESEKRFWSNLMMNLSKAYYTVLVVMDAIPSSVKGMIQFINRFTSFQIIGLEMRRYLTQDIEIIISDTFGAQISKEIERDDRVLWTYEKIEEQIRSMEDSPLKHRLIKILRWANENKLFVESYAKRPCFALKAPIRGRAVTIGEDGSIYCCFGKIEDPKYPSASARHAFVDELKALKLLPPNINPDEVRSGKNLTKKLHELTNRDFDALLKTFEKHLLSI